MLVWSLTLTWNNVVRLWEVKFLNIWRSLFLLCYALPACLFQDGMLPPRGFLNRVLGADEYVQNDKGLGQVKVTSAYGLSAIFCYEFVGETNYWLKLIDWFYLDSTTYRNMFLLAAADLMFLLLNNQGKRLGFRLGPPDRKPSVPLAELTIDRTLWLYKYPLKLPYVKYYFSDGPRAEKNV